MSIIPVVTIPIVFNLKNIKLSNIEYIRAKKRNINKGTPNFCFFLKVKTKHKTIKHAIKEIYKTSPTIPLLHNISINPLSISLTLEPKFIL
jgi:hypothetical protein